MLLNTIPSSGEKMAR
jgi:hypothetical protein